MGKIDDQTKEYMRRPEVFADVFNYLLYKGKSVIKPEHLHEKDTTEIVLPYGNAGKMQSQQKLRDVLKDVVIKEDEKATYLLILGIENQTDIHYAMPVRNMLYDSMHYAAQVSAIARQHKDAKDTNTNAEFLSGMHKDDRLVPVITLVVYFGQDSWDAPMSIHEMLNNSDPNILQYVQDYKLNLLAPVTMTTAEISKFSSNFKELAAIIQCAHDKEAFKALVKDNENFKHMDKLAAEIANAVIGANMKLIVDKEDKVNTCQAIIGIKEEGKVEGGAEKAKKAALNMHKKGESDTYIAEILEESLETVRQWIKDKAI